MSEIKTYKCDVCKNEVKGLEELAVLKIQLTAPNRYNKGTNRIIHICKTCSDKLDMKLPEFDKTMTQDEQLCDYLADFINAVVDDRYGEVRYVYGGTTRQPTCKSVGCFLPT